MMEPWNDDFCWIEQLAHDGVQDDEARYQRLVRWASRARGKNPNAFDALNAWLLDDVEWQGTKLAANTQQLMQKVIGRFREQNAYLRAELTALGSFEQLNQAVFPALDGFDAALNGEVEDEPLHSAVKRLFSEPAALEDQALRVQIAGGRTGPTGTDTVEFWGYINVLENLDAGVQWALFMPDVVRRQQNGFCVTHFEYRHMPALRFVGREAAEGDEQARREVFEILDAMKEYRSGFDADLLFMHHYGLGVDVGAWHGFWGRFLREDAPVPEGLVSFDLTPQREGEAGAPFIAQFAYAVFDGDVQAMHRREGFDSDAMYDVTRNIMLAQGVCIPYPDKYWTAEVFPEGWEKPGSAYLFSAEL